MPASDAPRLRLIEARLHERDVAFRMPFRFGAATLTAAPQASLRVRIACEGAEAEGAAAELMAPKWFDKNPALSNEDNFDQLRRATARARRLYLDHDRAETAFGLHAALYAPHRAACAAEGLNPLVAGFGTALLDRAILDALGRLRGRSIFALVAGNAPGIDARLTPDLAGFDLDGFLAALRPAGSIEARHTVGLADPLTQAELASPVADGLPQTLEAAIRAYGLRWFKLKVGGDLEADLDRLDRIAAVLEAEARGFRCTLDGNEQFADAEAAAELWDAMSAGRLGRLRETVAFIEQPIARASALEAEAGALARRAPLLIDESDSGYDAFPTARRLGYAGVSSKACKGVYRSLLNRARCAAWEGAPGEARCFMSAEDLTTQPGLAVQQDLALASLIGCRHVERNGHHYVAGMGGPEAEQRAFADAHPDLYRMEGGRARLRIESGRIALGSLDRAGFASAVLPDWAAMRETEAGG
jgi:hypothetical protein